MLIASCISRDHKYLHERVPDPDRIADMPDGCHFQEFCATHKVDLSRDVILVASGDGARIYKGTFTPRSSSWFSAYR